jgi:VWFA-related protein
MAFALPPPELSFSTIRVIGRKRVLFAFSIAAFCLFFFGSDGVVSQVSVRDPKQQDAQPQARINLSSVGFRSLSASARLSPQANLSLDFLDDNHVLLTFNPKKMFTRLPDCPPSHDDRVIHAVVLDLPGGRIIREADWYLHDHQRYLWPLGSGRFLLRKLNSLYRVDSDLRQTLLLTSPKPFLWITVTTDGKQILVERQRDEGKAKTSGKPAKPKVQIEFLDSESLSVQRVIKSEGVVNLEAVSTGFSDVIHGLSGKVWLVRFGPSGSQRGNITRVRSHCVPDVLFSSGTTLMVGRCAMNSSDYSVSSFTLTGRFLWRQHWSQHRYTPKLQRSEDGSRIAVSSIARVIDPAVSADQDAEDQDDTDRGLQQHIQVLDTASGTEVLSLTVARAALLAQNVSLSPDGRRLVLLRDTNLEMYSLPEMSQDDRAKYLAAKADVPGLYAAASELPSASTPEETTFASVDAAEETAREEQASAAEAAKPPESTTASAAPVASPASSEPPIAFRTSTRIVVEDVVVSDSKGHPVKGLRQQDFQLTEDGRAQSVRSFEEFPGAQATPTSNKDALEAVPKTSASETAQSQPKLPPNVFTNSRPTGPETGSSTIVVLDLLNTALPDQVRAKSYLIDFIKKRADASQIALCSLGSTLRLIQGFTRDEHVLIAAVKGKKGGVQAPPWQSDAGMDKSVQLARDLVMVAGNAESILAMQRTQNALDDEKAHDIDMRMRFTLDAFMQLARYLAGIPGRKNLVWLSASFPMSIFPNPDVKGYEPVTRNYENDIKKVTNLLADAHVAVYPVSATGLVAHNDVGNNTYFPSALPGSNGPTIPGAALIANTSANVPMPSSSETGSRNFRENEAGGQATMDEVATETGGKAFYNSNDIEGAIKAAVDEGSHYYTLSYTPTNKKYDGGFRKIKVALEQKGYHLAYRRGYYAQDPDAGAKDTRPPAQRIGILAMQQGAPQSRQVVFSTRVVPLGKPRKVEAAQAGMAVPKNKRAHAGPVEMQHFGIDYAVDASDLRFHATASGTYHALLSFMVTAFNDDGRLVASVISTATNDLTSRNYKDVMAGGFRIHQELDVPVEAVTLRIGVEDATSSHVGTLEIQLPVPVPPDAPQMTRLLPPIEPD